MCVICDFLHRWCYFYFEVGSILKDNDGVNGMCLNPVKRTKAYIKLENVLHDKLLKSLKKC